LYKIACFSMSNDVSTWASYEMLKYMSFPCQVLAKTCKLVPVMIMGSVLNKQRYSRWDYGQGMVMVMSLTAMVYSTTEEKVPPSFMHLEPGSWEHWWQTLCTGGNYAVGALFLGVYYLCDSFTSNWQAKLYTEYQLSEHQMMFAGNLCGIGFLAVTCVSQPRPFLATLEVMVTQPAVGLRVLALSVCAAVGQTFIYYTIKEFGPLMFTTIMTLRQILSVFISILWFGHPLTPLTAVCMFAIFSTVIARQAAKLRRWSEQQREKLKES